MILHITTLHEWEDALQKKEYAPLSLETDGFVHCSAFNQAVETANIFFRGQKGLILLCIDEEMLKSECRYEAPVAVEGMAHTSPTEMLFPHIYGPINIQAVVQVVDFPCDENGFFTLPPELLP